MSFKAGEWDSDETGDQLHTDLFKKKSKKPKKTKMKQKKDTQNTSTENKSIFKLSLSTNIKQNLKKILSVPIEETKDEEKKIEETTAKPQRKKIIRKRIKVPLVREAVKAPRIKKKLKRLDSKKVTKNEKSVSVAMVTGLNIATLKKQLAASLEVGQLKENSLRERMSEKLTSARFRYLNEQMYTSNGATSRKLFEDDPAAFDAYHEGYRQQVAQWPLNPLDIIITSIKEMPEEHIVGDFGCGDARLSESVPQKVHSFDLVAANEDVVACDMAHVPLKNSSLDVAVYCLSLMGTNLKDYLFEANRMLKMGGVLKIAEVESRFDGVETFIQGLQKFGFKNTWQDLSHNLFYFLDFVKERNVKHKNKLPTIGLNPCLYKKR